MIRTCDGTDENLKREEVTRTSRAGQETVEWISCDCGLSFDDVERLVVYPHHFIPSRENRTELIARVDEMVKQGRTAEDIRQALQLTSQPVGATVGASPTTTQGAPMGEDGGFRSSDEPTEAVAAEGTENTEAADANSLAGEEADLADAQAEKDAAVKADADARRDRY